MEPLFDGDSFQEEITTPGEAAACVDYLSHNEWKFRNELRSAGASHDEEENKVGQVWTNLVKSCKRVGFSSERVEQKAQQFGVSV